MSSLKKSQFFNTKSLGRAPNPRTMDRNVFNDDLMIIAVYLPKLEYMEHANFGPNDAMRVLNPPRLKAANADCATSQKELKFAYFPALETMGPMLRIDHDDYPSSPKLLHVPSLVLMKADAVRGAYLSSTPSPRSSGSLAFNVQQNGRSDATLGVQWAHARRSLL